MSDTVTEVRDRPILFSAPMVRAISEGRKTQTRRVVKIPLGGSPRPIIAVEHLPHLGSGYWRAGDGNGWNTIVCPYGHVGDRLWVQESYSLSGFHQEASGDDADAEASPIVRCRYELNGESREVRLTEAEGRKLAARVTDRHRVMSGRFMYRSCSRLTLEITDVRVQRVQDIDDLDAEAEGIPYIENPSGIYQWSAVGKWYDYSPDAFRALWESINGKRPGCSWRDNPWCWALTFRKVELANKLKEDAHV